MLAVTSAVLVRLLAEAAEAAPDECCGVLLGQGDITGIVPARNVAADPRRSFEIDPVVLVAAHKAARGGGPAIAGYYHSHPTGKAEPSAVDRALAAGDGKVWAIVAGGEVSFWRDAPDHFEALSYSVADG